MFDRQAFGPIEAIKIRAPHIARLGRGEAKVGEGNADFHLPELIAIVGIIRGALEFDGAGHVCGCETPIAFEGPRLTFIIEIVINNGVEHAAERIPLEFEIAMEIA